MSVKFVAGIKDMPCELDHTGWAQECMSVFPVGCALGDAAVAFNAPAHHFEALQVLMKDFLREAWRVADTLQKETKAGHLFFVLLAVNHQIADDGEIVKGLKKHFRGCAFSAHQPGPTVDFGPTKPAMAIATAIAKGERAIYIFIDVKGDVEHAHARLKREFIGFIAGTSVPLRIITEDVYLPLFHVSCVPPVAESLAGPRVWFPYQALDR